MLNIYLTEYYKNNGLYGSHVIALSFSQAQDVCDKRSHNETVVGIIDESDAVTFNSDHPL